MPGGLAQNDAMWDATGQTLLDRALAELAARQHGVVALAQLLALGLSPSGVRSRIAAERLHRVYRGVSAVGHPVLSREGRWMAAVLACGQGAVLSHRSAAALWGIRPTARERIDVTSPSRAGRRFEGIEVHSARRLTPADTTAVCAIPCTSVAWTLLDLAEVLNRRGVERACEQTCVLHLFDLGAVDDVLARARGRRGTPLLHAVLAELRPGTTITRNDLEERLLAICDQEGLPRPELNAWIDLGGGEAAQVDFLWRRERLIVETDGRRYHGTPQAFERDRRRDQRLLVAGWRVARFTWRQVAEAPAMVAATLVALLRGKPLR